VLVQASWCASYGVVKTFIIVMSVMGGLVIAETSKGKPCTLPSGFQYRITRKTNEEQVVLCQGKM